MSNEALSIVLGPFSPMLFVEQSQKMIDNSQKFRIIKITKTNKQNNVLLTNSYVDRSAFGLTSRSG